MILKQTMCSLSGLGFRKKLLSSIKIDYIWSDSSFFIFCFKINKGIPKRNSYPRSFLFMLFFLFILYSFFFHLVILRWFGEPGRLMKTFLSSLHFPKLGFKRPPWRRMRGQTLISLTIYPGRSLIFSHLPSCLLLLHLHNYKMCLHN